MFDVDQCLSSLHTFARRAGSPVDYADLPTLFGIFEQLGLKLEAQKAPVDIYHVDQIEKPSQN